AIRVAQAMWAPPAVARFSHQRLCTPEGCIVNYPAGGSAIQSEVGTSGNQHPLGRPKWPTDARVPTLCRASLGARTGHEPAMRRGTSYPPTERRADWASLGSVIAGDKGPSGP